ncbi:recombinase family protein [Selenomonas sp. KH1T6]|uniref:recombinase family protein n=1 Tax=Selenomonas sp. KH1T6 TaxID=3158784 RepID=UPI0008A765FB|nr:site-specific DNA recombinase [Selenomonas ruminantium]
MSLLERLRRQANGGLVTAALYARFSSDNQRNESIDAQVRAIKEFAKVNGIVIVAEYVDRAKSATTDDRPEFQRMIQESAKGNFRLLIVHKLDRFARNRNDSIAYRMKLQRNKVALLSVLEPFDEDRPESILLQSVIEGMNEFYSRNLAREVRKGLKENALRCKHTGGSPPLGYDVDRSTRQLVINEREAQAVREIFQLTLEGKGYSAITARLRLDGYKTKSGRDFGKNSLYEILHNPKYKGVYVYNRASPADPYTKKRNSHQENMPEDMIVVQGGVPAIVSEETFDRVQEILKRRKKVYRGIKKNQEQYLLRGKIICGVCGCSYVGNRKKSTGNRAPNISYRCNRQSRLTNIACKNREVNRDYIETFVLDRIEKSIFNKRTASIIIQKFEDYAREKNRERSETLRRLEAQVKEIDSKLENLSDILADGVERRQRTIILSKMEKLEDEKSGIQGYIAQAQASLELDVPDKEELRQCFLEAQSLFRKRSLEEMQQLVDLYVEKVIVKEGLLHVIQTCSSLIFMQKDNPRTFKPRD